ncbi:MAG: oxalurate catabolism protein HpxZ [Ilumatobacteraceae bacterium]|nr:oxalurate catabolism protein HpxZ [Ilumatobacteraceae bacterium]
MADDAELQTGLLNELSAAAHAYEDALTAGDTAAATAWFDDEPATSRFGPEGAQLDLEQVRALRKATAPTPPPVWLHDAVRLVGPGVGLHLALFDRGGATMQRTQVWVLRPGGWRITHAHVARLTVAS